MRAWLLLPAILLLHGLTDAPYSLHAVGAEFRERGFDVVSLRLPGHDAGSMYLLVTRQNPIRGETR